MKLLESLLPCPLLDSLTVGLARVTIAYGDGKAPGSTVSALLTPLVKSLLESAEQGVVGDETLRQRGLALLPVLPLITAADF